MNVAEYIRPASLNDAVAALADASAVPLAGGNSLLVEPQRSRLGAAKLVDLHRVPGLVGIEETADGGLRIGAMTPIVTIALSARIAEQYPALSEAAGEIGDAQVRNRATLGGNLAEGDPGADLPIVMMALGAQIQIQGSGGSRAISAEHLARGGQLGRGELITSVTLPAPAARSGSAYEKFKNPATLYAICGVAAAVNLAPDGVVASARVAVGGATETPVRLLDVEAALVGRPADAAAIAEAVGRIGTLSLRGDHFASAEYRRHLTGVLARRALTRSTERAG